MLLGTWLGTWKWFQMPTCPTSPLSPSQNRFFLTQAGYPVGKWITCPTSHPSHRFLLMQSEYPVGKWIICPNSKSHPSQLQNRFFLIQAGYPVGKWITGPRSPPSPSHYRYRVFRHRPDILLVSGLPAYVPSLTITKPVYLTYAGTAVLVRNAPY